MPAKKHHVQLTPEERQRVEKVARSYKHSERERKHARILLLSDTHHPDGGLKDDTIAREVKVCLFSVQAVRRRFAQAGLDAALFRKVQSHRKARVLDGVAEAFLIASVCGAPPEGQKRWSLHLLKDRLIQQGYTHSVSHETVRQTLKKMNLNPG
jgi:transposase